MTDGRTGDAPPRGGLRAPLDKLALKLEKLRSMGSNRHTRFARALVALVLAFGALAPADLTARQAAAPSAAPAPAAPAPASPPAAPPGWTPPPIAPESRVWPWEGSDLAPDPAVRFGRLDNGLRYAIRVNRLPAEEVTLRLRIDAGSLMETDDQRGFAHYLEHMAFNGSKNIPEGELVKTMARLGSSFGADVNAYTSAHETVYKLDLPRAGGGRLETALKVFRETADRLTIAPAAVERERGVVLSEMRAADNVATRLAREQGRWLVPDARETSREPLGVEATVRAATAEGLRAFYETWYRPERAILVVAGDVDADATEALIRATFADWRPATPAEPAEPDPGRWPSPSLRALVQVNADLPEGFMIAAMRPARRPDREIDVAARRVWSEVDEIAADVIRRRLSRLALAADPPLSGASYGTQRTELGWGLMIGVSQRDRDWRRALDAVAREVRMIREGAFSQAEIDEAVRDRREAYDRAVAQAPTRRTPALADATLAALGADAVKTTPETEKAVFERAAALATPARLQEIAAWWWSDVEPAFVMVRRDDLPGGADALKTAWREAMARPLEARAEVATKTFVPVPVGPPGRIVSTERRAGQDVTIARFENGVTFAFKRTAFTRERVSIAVTMAGGDLSSTNPDRDWSTFAQFAWMGGGFAGLTLDEVRSAFAGRTSGPGSVSVGLTSTTLGAAPATKDFAEQMQVLLAQTLAPEFGPLGPRQLREGLRQLWPTFELTAAGAYARDAETYFMTGARRFTAPDLEASLATDDARAVASLEAILATAPINVTIVGDVDFETARDAVAATFGALPKRTGGPDLSEIERWRTLPTGGPPRVVRHRGPDTQAIVETNWFTPGGRDVATARALVVLRAVVADRVRDAVREATGQAYSPGAGWSPIGVVDRARLSMSAQVLPKDVESVDAAFAKIARDLATTGPTADEVARAVAPILEERAQARQTDGFWVGRMNEIGLPRTPDDPPQDALALDPGHDAAMRAVTPARLKALARAHLRPENAVRIHVLPDPASALRTPSADASPTPAAPR